MNITMPALEVINNLLQGEIAAVETYVEALEKFDGFDNEVLNQIKLDHIDAGNSLRQYAKNQDGLSDHGSGAWGAWVHLLEGASKTFARVAALRALKEGEAHGIEEYEEAVGEKHLSEDIKVFIREIIIPEGERHIAAIDQLIDRNRV